MPASHSSSILVSLFGQKAWSNSKLFEVLEADLRRLDPAQQAQILRTLDHAHAVDCIFRAHLRAEPHGYTAANSAAVPDLARLRDAVAQTDAWFQAYVRDLDPALPGESIAFRFTDGDRGRMSREEMLFHLITHGAWHRGEVGQILEQQGVASPPDSLTKFLHATEPARRLG